MMPTGSGKVGQNVRTPDGDGIVKIVHNQDNVTVELKGRTYFNAKTKEIEPLRWVGDVAECDLWCGDCEGFHTYSKHLKKVEVENV